MSDEFLKRASTLMQDIKNINKKKKEDTISFSDLVPKEFFEFICYRKEFFRFISIFRVIDSDYFLVVNSSKSIVLLHKSEFNPFDEDHKIFSNNIKSSSPIDEILGEIPKKAASFLCFNFDIIKSETKIKQ